MHASIRLGRVHGIEVGLNWSWLVIFALIVWSLGASVFPADNPGLGDGAYAAMAAVGALLFFTSLVLHELGHAVVAQREGMEIDGITLWVFGGIARFNGRFPSAGAELRIALAGPLVSVALGAAFTLGAKLLPLPSAVDGVATWLGEINLVLVAFNMLPALPLDGGRVLRAALWVRSGDFSRATRRAGAIARAIAQTMIALGVAVFLVYGALGGMWLALIGWFILAAARAESGYGVMREALAGLRVGDAMVSDPVTVPADGSLLEFLEGPFARTHYASYPVTRGDDIVGVIAVGDVDVLLASQLERTTVAERMLPLSGALVLDANQDLADAATELMQTSLGRGLVARDGRVAGLVSLTDLQDLVKRQARPAAPAH